MTEATLPKRLPLAHTGLMGEDQGTSTRIEPRALAFLAAPLAIAVGDFIFRFDADLYYFTRLSPGNFFGSLALSIALWWTMSRIAGSFDRRWVAAAIIATPWALLINAIWGYRDVRGHDPTPGIAFYIVHEPKNSVDILASGLDPVTFLRLSVLAAAMIWGLGAYRTEWSRLKVGCAAIAVLSFGVASAGWYLPNPSTEVSYTTDVYSGVVFGESVQRAADLGTNSVLSETEREPLQLVSPPERAPNVVLIMGESLNRNMFSHHGYSRPTTPRIDRFLARNSSGVVDFEWAYANSSFSPVSVGTLLTGAYAGRTEADYHAAPSLWQYARAAGIYSFLVATQQWSWSNLDFFLLGAQGPEVALTADNLALPIANDTGVDDRLAAKRFVEQLGVAAKRDEPWFGTFQSNATHFPLLVDPDVPWEIESIEGQVASATRVTDDAIGEILEALESGGHLEDTVVIFTADHSEVFRNTLDRATEANLADDFRFGGRIESCHPLLARVPFFVYVPPSMQGEGGFASSMRARSHTLVSHADVAPTILDAWGIEPVAAFDGVSVAAPEPSRDHVLCFTCPSWSRWLLNGVAYIGEERYIYLREDFAHPMIYERTDPEIYRSRLAGHKPAGDDLEPLLRARSREPIIDRYLSFDRVAPLLSGKSTRKERP